MNRLVPFNTLSGLLRRLVQIDRAQYVWGAGAMTVFLSALTPWYRQPSSSRSFVTPGHQLIVVDATTAFELIMRVAVFLCAVWAGYVLMAGRIRSTFSRAASRRLGWMLLALFLVFPYWIRMRNPEQLYDSHLLHDSLEQVIIDMEATMTNQQRDWRDWQRISIPVAQEGPEHISPYDDDWRIPSLTAFLFQGTLFNIIWGVNNIFLAFAGIGWLLALGGTVLILLGGYLQAADPLPRIREDLAFGAVFTVILVGALLIPQIMCGYHLSRGRESYYRGELPAAKQHVEHAVGWWPGMGHSWLLKAQLGRIAQRLGCENCFETHLARAHDAAFNRRYEEALNELLQAQRLDPGHTTGLRFWMGTVHGAYANLLFDRGQYTAAKEHWEQALTHLPTYAFAWYGLSLVYFRLRDFEQAAQCQEQLLKLQAYFTFDWRLTIRAQAYVARSWAAYWAKDWPLAHHFYSLALSPERWN